jgi:hypothetical protein
MTGLLVFIIVVLVILALVIYGIQQVSVIEQPIKSLIILVVVLIAALAIAQRAGVL